MNLDREKYKCLREVWYVMKSGQVSGFLGREIVRQVGFVENSIFRYMQGYGLFRYSLKLEKSELIDFRVIYFVFDGDFVVLWCLGKE